MGASSCSPLCKGLGQVLVLLILLVTAPAVHADESGGKPLRFHVAHQMPPESGISEICCNSSIATHLTPVSRTLSTAGRNVVWLRVADPLPPGMLQITPVVDRATLFVPADHGGWNTIETGDTIAGASRSHLSPFMTLPVAEGIRDRPAFIRIAQEIPETIELKHWDLVSFSQMQSRDRTIKMFLLGFLVAMIVYNLVVSVLVRDPAFALNACTISALLAMALYLSGYGAAYVWPQVAGLSNVVQLGAIIAGVVFGSMFMWLFIKSKGEPVTRGWPMLVPAALSMILPAALLFVPMWLVTMAALAISFALFATALVLCSRRAFMGEPKARVLLIPLLFAMIPGVGLVALDKYFGIRFVDLGNNGMEITLCLEAVLFSLALASRIRLTEQESMLARDRIVLLQNEAAIRTIVAQDDERRRLAKELHDGVGQDFLVVLGGLKRLAGNPDGENVPSRLGALADAAGSALTNLRRISRDMHPASLEHLGLSGSIEELVRQTRTANNLDITLDMNIEEERLNPDQRLHLYRIVQECLSNVLRHAEADGCLVRLVTDAGSVKLTVEDDGRGFDEASVERLPGLGLVSIDERVRACGGQWSRSPSKPDGARIEVVLPLAGQAAEIR